MMDGVLAWIQQQGAIMFAVFGDIASNKPAPARLVLEEVVYAVVVAALLITVIRFISKAVSK